jgi:hypothetical protein
MSFRLIYLRLSTGYMGAGAAVCSSRLSAKGEGAGAGVPQKPQGRSSRAHALSLFWWLTQSLRRDAAPCNRADWPALVGPSSPRQAR